MRSRVVELILLATVLGMMTGCQLQRFGGFGRDCAGGSCNAGACAGGSCAAPAYRAPAMPAPYSQEFGSSPAMPAGSATR